MEKICIVCRKPFSAANPRYKMCSAECRKKHYAEYDKIRLKAYYHSGAGKKKHKTYYKPVEKLCASCNKPLPDGRQTYCLRCLLLDFKYGDTDTAYKRLACRGYDTKAIWRTITELNV